MNIFLDAEFEDVYRAYPIVLVDAGARGGLKKNWLAAQRYLRTIGFEPDQQEYARLLETRSGGSTDLVCGVALHNKPGAIDLHVTRDRGLTSVFEPNRPFLDAFPSADRFDIVDRRQVSADTLDSQLHARELTDADFLKIDTQGSELYVLEGSEQALAWCCGVEVEVEFTPLYKDQPLFGDVDQHLRDRGFQLFDLRPCYWKRAGGRHLGGPYGQIVWADALYLKSTAALGAALAGLSPHHARSKLLKAISISVLYGYYDYALYLAHEVNGVLSAAELELVEAGLRSDGVPRQPLPPFPGKTYVRRLFRRLAGLFTEPDGSWSVGEGKTGNL